MPACPQCRCKTLHPLVSTSCSQTWDTAIVILHHGQRAQDPDVLPHRLSSDVTIRPSLSAFDRALADLRSKTGA
jgi:hypothetical protein